MGNAYAYFPFSKCQLVNKVKRFPDFETGIRAGSKNRDRMFTAERKDGQKNKKMVEFNQSGYIGSSRSVRALEAYEAGEMPASKWTKAAILEAIGEAYGKARAEKAQKVGLADLRASFLERSSWHHTGKYANKTYFYSLADRSACEADQLINQLIAEKKEGKKEEKKENKYSYLVLTREKNISIYRKWPKWKNFTYFCILKNDEKKARVIAGDDDDQSKDIYGLHIVDKAFFESRKDFIKAIKKHFNLRKIGSFSKKIDEFLKK